MLKILNSGHGKRIRALEQKYLSVIEERNAECGGLIFTNRYLLEQLAMLEPQHPLRDADFRQKIGKWGAFSYSEAEGSVADRFKAASGAGATFSIPPFVTKKQIMLERKRASADIGMNQETMR